ncbi:unnamed protein product [Brachionus calyciflorus]|uniref:Protein-serine/threonine kinase n=1 Tax=Brachionus calyciflorus TaxID=104777 RepID=A0A814EIH1_9BILA|nr:unnamed protein product [Brachionus calyciflorus]
MTKHLKPSSKFYTNLKLASNVTLARHNSTHNYHNDEILKQIVKKKQQHLNYSSMAEHQTYCKRKTDQSESRERLTTISYFYSDPEIDKATDKPVTRLSPMSMMYMGVSDNNSHLLRSANYLRNELPIRLAHMIKELRNLPFIVACHPSILEIHERCIKTFRQFDQYDKEIKTLESEKGFNNLVFNMLEMNKDILALLCDGFKDTRRYISSEGYIKTHLNKILSTRLGLRLLCEHHLALNKQSNLNKILLSNDIFEKVEVKRANNDNFTSTYLSSNSGDNTNGNLSNVRDDEWVGIIHQKFSPKKLIDNSAKLVTRLCMEKYGVAPKIKIDGHINSQFPYLPMPLEYIMPELLKNSFRATTENHRNSSSLPDVCVTIAVNDRDFIFRIRDRGGGIPHALGDKIFDYHFSTANENKEKEVDDKMNSNFSLDCLNTSGFGMMCSASASQGLAVMHGYGFGLPTSKAYAEYLGGTLSFQSMQGIGSDFYLRLSLFDIEPEVVRI